MEDHGSKIEGLMILAVAQSIAQPGNLAQSIQDHLRLAQKKYTQNYADAKTSVVREILDRAQAATSYQPPALCRTVFLYGCKPCAC